MNAISMLRAEHDSLRASLRRVGLEAGAGDRAGFLALKREVELHYVVEEETFYPAIHADPRTFEFGGMDRHQHQRVAADLSGMAALPAGSAEWPARFDAMRGRLCALMDDEERDIFGKISGVMRPEELAELGLRMAAVRSGMEAAARMRNPREFHQDPGDDWPSR